MTETPLFEAVRREATLSYRVTGQIEAMIVANRLLPGDRLPPERELASQFGVSRTVIREAITALMAKSLLEMLPAGGAVVRRPSRKSVSQSMSLFLRGSGVQPEYSQISEVRRLLEVEIAGLAAERRSPEDILEMTKLLDEAKANMTDREAFAHSDVAFHAALAEATHNELFRLLLDSVGGILLRVRYTGYDAPGAPERGLWHHKAIFEQVKAGDPEKARAAMRDHLDEADQTQREAAAIAAGQIERHG